MPLGWRSKLGPFLFGRRDYPIRHGDWSIKLTPREEKQGIVLALAVAKEYEGKGVAQKLMEHAEQWAREQGFKQLVLNVFAANAKVLKIYQKLGYETEQIKMVKILSDEA